MNANFKGVAIILSDKSADDIWEKIGLIDDKDAEQDRKDEEQDEAIAGKLDKDDGMGLVDEKLGGIDNAIDSLAEDLNGLSDRISAMSDKLDSVIENAYNIDETVLWEGIAEEVDDEIELNLPASLYDYIDIYYNPAPYVSGGILTVSSDKLVSETVIINDLSFANGLSEQQYLTLQSVGGSETTFKVMSTATWEWDGDHTHDAVYEEGISNIDVYKVVGRKMTPLSDIIIGE